MCWGDTGWPARGGVAPHSSGRRVRPGRQLAVRMVLPAGEPPGRFQHRPRAHLPGHLRRVRPLARPVVEVVRIFLKVDLIWPRAAASLVFCPSERVFVRIFVRAGRNRSRCAGRELVRYTERAMLHCEVSGPDIHHNCPAGWQVVFD